MKSSVWNITEQLEQTPTLWYLKVCVPNQKTSFQLKAQRKSILYRWKISFNWSSGTTCNMKNTFQHLGSTSFKKDSFGHCPIYATFKTTAHYSPSCCLGKFSIWLDRWLTLLENDEEGFCLWLLMGGRWGHGGSRGAIGLGNIWSCGVVSCNRATSRDTGSGG